MELQKNGIPILPPDINHSELDFKLYQGKILVGLKAIKGLRNDFIKQIVNLKRPFKSLDDFLRKIDSKYLQEEAIKALIMAGCFDSIDKNRNKLLANCKELIENVQLTGQNLSLAKGLGMADLQEKPMPTNSERAAMEEQVLGFSTTVTALVAVQKYAQKYNAKELDQYEINETGISVGKLMSIKQIRTKNNSTMAFTRFADTTSKQEVVIFPNIYERVKPILKEGDIYLLGIRTSSDRYDSSKKQYVLTNLKRVNFKE